MARTRPRKSVHHGEFGQVTTVLISYAAANALLVTIVAVGHPWTEKTLASTPFDRLLVAYGVFWEAVFLMLPVLFAALAAALWKPKSGVWLGAVGLPFVSIIYYADLMSSLLIDEHVWSPTTLRLVGTLIPWLPDYLSESRTMPVVAGLLSFVAAETAALVLIGSVVGRWPWRPGRWARGLLYIGLAILVLPFADALAGRSEWRRSLLDVPRRHPLSLLGVGDRGKALPETISRREAALAAHFLNHSGRVRDIERAYVDLTITAGPQWRPDILIVIAESLRAEAFGPKSAPNLTELAAEGLVSERHFSTGNATNFGHFGVLYGLDPVLYNAAACRWTPALPRLLREAGYFTAFLGSGNNFHPEIEQMIGGPTQYDIFEWGLDTPFTRRDQKLCDIARGLLDRQNQAVSRERPVCVILAPFCTHADYHCEPQDRVFHPAFNDSIPFPPFEDDERLRVRNRYRNSVHALDRMLGPLFHRDRIIIVVGDHGESLGEDGWLFHGTKASAAQITTPFIFHVPDQGGRRINGPTSHIDILPGLLDQLKIEIDSPWVLPGRSPFQKQIAEPKVPPRRFGVALFGGHHFGGHLALLGGTAGNGFPPRVLHIKASLDPPKFRLRGIGDPQGDVAIPSDAALFDAREDRLVSDFELWMENSLGSQGHVADAAKELRQALRSADPDIRAEACRLIGRLGPEAGPFIPDLKAKLGDTSAVRKAASLALSRIYD